MKIYIIMFISMFCLFGCQAATPRSKSHQMIQNNKIRDKISDEQASNQGILTEEEAVENLFEYVYPGKKYFMLATVTHTQKHSVYEFTTPRDKDSKTVRRIESYGLTENEKYYIFALYIDNYIYNKNGVREYSHANFATNYAINRETKQIIQQRKEDEETGDWIYNDQYSEIFN